MRILGTIGREALRLLVFTITHPAVSPHIKRAIQEGGKELVREATGRLRDHIETRLKTRRV